MDKLEIAEKINQIHDGLAMVDFRKELPDYILNLDKIIQSLYEYTKNEDVKSLIFYLEKSSNELKDLYFSGFVSVYNSDDIKQVIRDLKIQEFVVKQWE